MNVVERRIHNVSANTSFLMPKKKSLCRTIQRERSKILKVPALPTNAIDIEIPEMFSKTIKDDKFLIEDYVKDNVRLLVYTTTDKIRWYDNVRCCFPHFQSIIHYTWAI